MAAARKIIIVKIICICDMILFIKLTVTIAMNGKPNFRIVSFLNILLIVCLINLLVLLFNKYSYCYTEPQVQIR